MTAEVVVLGSGTSNGVPIIGFDYPEAFLANSKNHRLRPSILINGSQGSVLVDCTPDMRTQLLRERVKSLDAVLITHAHADHIMGMDDLRAFSLRSGRNMPIVALPDAQETIRRVFPYAFMESTAGVEVPRFELLDVPETWSIAGLEIHLMTVMHGPMPVIALRINNFAYVTDVSEIPPAAWERLQGLDTLILDAVRRKPHPNHFHLQKAIEVAQQLNPKVTYFTHLSHDFDHDLVESTELPGNIRLAYDGLRIIVE